MTVGVLSYQAKHGRKRGSIGSSIIRAEWLVNHWPEAKLWHNGMKCDVIIGQKVYWNEFYHDFPGIKILDVCDPDWHQADIRSVLWLKKLEPELSAITCATESLTNFVKNCVKSIPVITIPDRIDTTQFPSKPKEHEGLAKTAVWFGFAHNAAALNAALPTLGKMGLKLLVVSNNPYRPFQDFGTEIQNIQWDESADSMIREADMAILPLMAGGKWDFKSNNRTLRAWANGLPVAHTIADLKRFMDPAERTAEVKLRWQEVQEKHHVRHSVEQYKELISQICKQKESSPSV